MTMPVTPFHIAVRVVERLNERVAAAITERIGDCDAATVLRAFAHATAPITAAAVAGLLHRHPGSLVASWHRLRQGTDAFPLRLYRDALLLARLDAAHVAAPTLHHTQLAAVLGSPSDKELAARVRRMTTHGLRAWLANTERQGSEHTFVELVRVDAEALRYYRLPPKRGVRDAARRAVLTRQLARAEAQAARLRAALEMAA